MMHARTMLLLALALLVSLPAVRLRAGEEAESAKPGIPLEAVIREVEKSLVDAHTQLVKRGLPRMRTASVTLQTLFVRDSVGGGYVGVYTEDMPFDATTAHSVTLTVTRASDETRYETAAAAAASPRLVENLVTLAQSSKLGQARDSGMRISEVSAVLQLVIRRANTSGPFEIAPLEAGAKPVEGRAIHTLAVTYSPTGR